MCIRDRPYASNLSKQLVSTAHSPSNIKPLHQRLYWATKMLSGYQLSDQPLVELRTERMLNDACWEQVVKFAIVGAEYILHWLPVGTHDWQKFVEPKKLISEAKKSSLLFKEICGVKFNPILNNWNISKDTSVNYIAKFLKS